MMKTRKIENRLALLGALIVLIGVTWAAGSAFAAEPSEMKSATKVARVVTDETILGARKAITEAAEEAAKALEAETRFDLDNQIAGLTTTLMAGRR